MKTTAENKRRIADGDYTTEQKRWTAVAQRDANADGKFYYSVKTTGIYCRPSCAARRPQRENVQFHESCEAAERAGFRACKRCQPNAEPLNELHIVAIARACRTIKTAEVEPDLGTLAKAAGLSRFHFHRLFKKAVGLTPKAYAKAHRGDRVRSELSRRKSVTEAIYNAGFNSNSRFYEESISLLGMNPRAFQNGGSGLDILFAVGECSLGSILVASSRQGVCAILLGDDPDALVKDLQDRFPQARLIGGDENFERLVARVVGFVEAPRLGLNLPLDVRGTAFQRRVWNALQKISPGSTATYSEIARRIGQPKSIRAVAGACAANAIAVAIPCHRVLRSDGNLSGYRWGVERKRALLKRERESQDESRSGKIENRGFS
ncbi:MAG TPA: bifunctional DNA-binding transcriptional regulator/O6-methylguanine-DNA methyltransferase Ada [Verrucomicrobiae bacterium]